MIAMDTKKLRQKILDLAIRGKLVPQDPNDEPASVLLERIRAEKERLIAEGKIKRPKKSKSSSSESHYQNLTPPFPIPDSWEWVRLGDIIEEPKYGTSAKSLKSGKMPVLRMGNLTRDGRLDYSNLVYTDSIYDIEEYNLKKGDILFNRTNSSEWVGKCALYDALIPAIYAGYLVRVRPIIVLSKYLIDVLTSDYYRDWCYCVKTDAVNQSNINATKLSDFRVPLPPIEEQLRIYSKFQEYNEFINRISDIEYLLKNKVENVKHKILELAMQGKLVPQDLADEAAANMLRRINPKAKIITDNPHSWNIPESWCWCQLGDIFYHNTGKALNASNGDGIEYEYITTSNVYWERFELSSLKIMLFKDSEIDKCSVKKGDLLVCEGGDIGRAAIWDLDRSVMIQNHLHRLRPYSVDICTRLYCKILRAYKHKQLIGGKGIALQGFSSNALHKLIVPLIPAEEQRKMLDRIESLFAILGRIEISLQS